MTSALVLDIEGTTSPTASVHDVLFDYTRERMSSWFDENRADEGKQLLVAARRYAGRPGATDDETVAVMREWLDTNVKCQPLKTLQGLICGAGFRNGELHGEFFPDVVPALRRWRENGTHVYIFSSGSVRNQRDWFIYTRAGRLDHLVDGYFDLENAGDKRTPTSYRRITDSIRVAPSDTMFLTDSAAELDAAFDAGWSVVGVARAGEPARPTLRHQWVTTFDEVALDIGSLAVSRGSER